MSIEAAKQRTRALGQSHIFTAPANGAPLDEADLAAQVETLEASYPGGLDNYLATAKRLLSGAQGGSGSLEGKTIRIPPNVFRMPLPEHPSEDATEADKAAVFRFAEAGQALLRQSAFVLVAGGLGERLGYHGIKLQLPVETATDRTYIQHYCEFLLTTVGPHAPFAIMTSDDTDTLTRQLLDAKQNFGLHNITIMKQNGVPCLQDSSAHLAFADQVVNGVTQRKLLKKPHGHGEVHHLVHAFGLHQKWQALGVKYVCFFQDTNASATWTLPLSLAVCEEQKWEFGFTCVPRLPGESVGCLVEVSSTVAESGKTEPQPAATVNLEYNVVDAALKKMGQSGDVAAAGSRFSAFPGSINTLLCNMNAYVAVMERTHGACPEFINPKYTDATKTAFKSPTRVESLMQDIALLLQPSGGIVFPRWLYHPVKNDHFDGALKAASGQDAHTAATGEAAVYEQNAAWLRWLGVRVRPSNGGATTLAGGLPVSPLPAVAFDAAFAPDLLTLRRRFPHPEQVSISDASVLVLSGPATVESLALNGALSVTTTPETSVRVTNLHVNNSSWSVAPFPNDEGNIAPKKEAAVNEAHAIRKFSWQKSETATFAIAGPGDFAITTGGNSSRL